MHAVIPGIGRVTDVVVRFATRADLPAIGRLGASLVQLHHNFDRQRFIPPSPGTERGYGSYIGTQLGEPSVVVMVAERDGRVIGYTYAGLEEHDWMSLRGPAGVLYDIIVDPAARGGGAGRALLEGTVAELKKRGAPRVVLLTAERNAAAHKLFESAGFRRTMIEMTRELGEESTEH